MVSLVKFLVSFLKLEVSLVKFVVNLLNCCEDVEVGLIIDTLVKFEEVNLSILFYCGEFGEYYDIFAKL